MIYDKPIEHWTQEDCDKYSGVDKLNQFRKPLYKTGQQVMFRRSELDNKIFIAEIAMIQFAPAHNKWWYKFKMPNIFLWPDEQNTFCQGCAEDNIISIL